MHRVLALGALPFLLGLYVAAALVQPYLGLMCLLTAGWWSNWLRADPRPRRRWGTTQLAIFWLLCLPTLAREQSRGFTWLQARVDLRGAETLSTHELRAIWLQHGAMGAAGHLLGLHEVGWEAWGLHSEGPEQRRWSSAFALRDPLVRRHVAAWKGAAAGPLPEVTLAWSSYFDVAVSPSVSLALNCPSRLGGVRTEEGVLQLTVTCPVAYPQRARLHFGTLLGESIGLEEGVFWAAQERGWLHPYTVVWTFEVHEDDTRLSDRETVRRGLREQIVHRLREGL